MEKKKKILMISVFMIFMVAGVGLYATIPIVVDEDALYETRVIILPTVDTTVDGLTGAVAWYDGSSVVSLAEDTFVITELSRHEYNGRVALIGKYVVSAYQIRLNETKQFRYVFILHNNASLDFQNPENNYRHTWIHMNQHQNNWMWQKLEDGWMKVASQAFDGFIAELHYRVQQEYS